MPENIWPLILVIVGVAIVLALLSWGLERLRQSLKDSSTFQSGTGWTIEQINELHQSGQLTDKQYRFLRDAVIKGMQTPQQEDCPQR